MKVRLMAHVGFSRHFCFGSGPAARSSVRTPFFYSRSLNTVRMVSSQNPAETPDITPKQLKIVLQVLIFCCPITSYCCAISSTNYAMFVKCGGGWKTAKENSNQAGSFAEDPKSPGSERKKGTPDGGDQVGL
ncbi:hypothetical protein Y1Q_0010212 [Alligator mississippiensis]|uniref:Uncharacterized protein n=1 Tax=Alligator mississippiensis TaxID=8496 RepID=A0A151NGB3_ALLMI|nr:hypothetical protein Y1Q_0010212 [Alligator mississippiensis]